jgi:hypothetical protein
MSQTDHVYSILYSLHDKHGSYFNIDAVYKDLMYSLRKNDLGPKNTCLLCGIDMGIHNPRQLCGKTVCENLSETTSLNLSNNPS